MLKSLMLLLTILAAPLLIPYMLVIQWLIEDNGPAATQVVMPSLPLVLACIAVEAALVLLWLRFRR